MTPTERDALLAAGITVYWYAQGFARIDRAVTTYKTNSKALPSDAFHDLTTRLTLTAYRQISITLLQPLLGKILVDDITEVIYDFGVNPVDAGSVRVLLLDQYTEVAQPRGWVLDAANYTNTLVVVKTGPNTLEYTEQPTIAGHLFKLRGTLSFKLG